jgi:tRNA(Glu) U13 pseudouridine synthase TruD
VRPEGLSAVALSGDEVELRFVLPPGSYATVLVEALLGDGGASGDGESPAAVP